MEVTCYLSIGTNLGDKPANLSRAIELLSERCGTLYAQSNLYATEPKGFESEHQFLNCCVSLKTEHPANELLQLTQQIERDMGRESKSGSQYSDRLIDIDIIFYGDQIINEKHLSIPHKLFRERKFVLQPLNDIANSFIDPVTNCTIQTLLDKCFDKSEIYTYK